MPRLMLIGNECTLVQSEESMLPFLSCLPGPPKIPVFGVPAAHVAEAVIQDRLPQHVRLGDSSFVHPDDGMFVFVLTDASPLPSLNHSVSYSNWDTGCMQPGEPHWSRDFAPARNTWDQLDIAYCVRVRNPASFEVFKKDTFSDQCRWLTHSASGMVSVPPGAVSLQITDVYLTGNTKLSIPGEIANAVSYATSLLHHPTVMKSGCNVHAVLVELPEAKNLRQHLELWYLLRKQANFVELEDCFIDSDSVFMVTFKCGTSATIDTGPKLLKVPTAENGKSYAPLFRTLSDDDGAIQKKWKAVSFVVSIPKGAWVKSVPCSVTSIAKLLNDVAIPQSVQFAGGAWSQTIGMSGPDRVTLTSLLPTYLLELRGQDANADNWKKAATAARDVSSGAWQSLTITETKDAAQIRSFLRELCTQNTVDGPDETITKLMVLSSVPLFNPTAFTLSSTDNSTIERNEVYAVAGIHDDRVLLYLAQTSSAVGFMATQLLLFAMQSTCKYINVAISNVDVKWHGMDPAFWYFHRETLKRILLFANTGFVLSGGVINLGPTMSWKKASSTGSNKNFDDLYKGKLPGATVLRAGAEPENIWARYFSADPASSATLFASLPATSPPAAAAQLPPDTVVAPTGSGVFLRMGPPITDSLTASIPPKILSFYRKITAPVEVPKGEFLSVIFKRTGAVFDDTGIEASVREYIEKIEKEDYVLMVNSSGLQPTLLGSFNFININDTKAAAAATVSWGACGADDAWRSVLKDAPGCLISVQEFVKRLTGPTYLKPRSFSPFMIAPCVPRSNYLPTRDIDDDDTWDWSRKSKRPRRHDTYGRAGPDDAAASELKQQIDQQRGTLERLKATLPPSYNRMIDVASEASHMLQKHMNRM